MAISASLVKNSLQYHQFASSDNSDIPAHPAIHWNIEVKKPGMVSWKWRG